MLDELSYIVNLRLINFKIENFESLSNYLIHIFCSCVIIRDSSFIDLIQLNLLIAYLGKMNDF